MKTPLGARIVRVDGRVAMQRCRGIHFVDRAVWGKVAVGRLEWRIVLIVEKASTIGIVAWVHGWWV